jgi:hypothetical protein
MRDRSEKSEMRIEMQAPADPHAAAATGHPAAMPPRGDLLAEVGEALQEWRQRMLDQRSAAAMLGISDTKLRRWLLAGRGPQPFRDGEGPGGRVMFEVAEIRAYLADPAAYEESKRNG